MGLTKKGPLVLLLAANVAVYLVVSLLNLLNASVDVTGIALAGPFRAWLSQPWSIVTYMFVQFDFLHLLFNMLWLWAFGAIFERLGEGKDLLLTYIASGLTGGIFFLVASSALAMPQCYLVGSSASVLGVVAGSATRHPRLELNLVLFGNVRLVWVAIIAILLLGIAPGIGNVPTMTAHLAGVAGGWLLNFLLQKGLKPGKKTGDTARRPLKNVRMHERRGLSASEQAELDDLLAKIKASGYKSLSMKERQRLFALSNRIS